MSSESPKPIAGGRRRWRDPPVTLAAIGALLILASPFLPIREFRFTASMMPIPQGTGSPFVKHSLAETDLILAAVLVTLVILAAYNIYARKIAVLASIGSLVLALTVIRFLLLRAEHTESVPNLFGAVEYRFRHESWLCVDCRWLLAVDRRSVVGDSLERVVASEPKAGKARWGSLPCHGHSAALFAARSALDGVNPIRYRPSSARGHEGPAGGRCLVDSVGIRSPSAIAGWPSGNGVKGHGRAARTAFFGRRRLVHKAARRAPD